MSDDSRKCTEGWLNTYINYTAEQESPEIYHLWCGVSIIAATLKRNVAFDHGILGDVYPNLFVILTGDSAEDKKTTAINLGKRLLREAVEDINILPKKVTPEALLVALKEEYDKTETGAGYVAAGELCLFLGEGEQRSRLVALLLDGYDSDDVMDERTIYRDHNKVINPCLNLIAATTPSQLLSLPRTILEGGWVGRHIFVYSDEDRPANAYPSAKPEMKANLTEDLKRMGELKGTFKQTPEAREAYRVWYEETRMKENNKFGLKGYAGRRGANALKLAMVMSANRSNSLVIDEADIRMAITLLKATEAQFPDVMKKEPAHQVGDDMQYTRQVIDKFQPVSYSELLRKVSRRISAAKLQDILNDLVGQGDITERERVGRRGPVRTFTSV